MSNNIVMYKYGSDSAWRVKESSFSSKELFLSDGSKLSREILLEIHNDKFPELFESAVSEEKASIDKFNFTSITGKRIIRPFATYLWYGKYIYFADIQELSDFNYSRFVIRSQDICPICGEPKGSQLRYCFTEVTGLPFEVYVCSKECLNELTHKIPFYRRILSELKGKFPYTPSF